VNSQVRVMSGRGAINHYRDFQYYLSRFAIIPAYLSKSIELCKNIFTKTKK
jgi:hypothetical protein